MGHGPSFMDFSPVSTDHWGATSRQNTSNFNQSKVYHSVQPLLHLHSFEIVNFIIYTLSPSSPSSPSLTGATSIITTISGALPALWESQSKLPRLS